MDIELLKYRSIVESKEKWREIGFEIPSLNFKEKWNVKIIPPFAGAVARFMIMKDDVMVCSVYLDWYSQLGYMDAPYFELYPFKDDTRRYMLNETKELLEDIELIWNEYIV